MRLRSLTLKNIRSYHEATLEFPDGITLLSGDIGAGKSTLLLAIEFGLFGISRTDLSGSALLRHGAQDGSVIIRFAVSGVEYTVTRTLRRTSSGIVQDNGWIETENAREALTPSELRARIFTILGYPLQFLAKQRNALYRFTIYTPQEEMKAVLTQTADERVETVRRIFGVDAYRIARDNARLAAKALRDREQTHEAVIARIAAEQERIAARIAAGGVITQQKETLVRERATLTLRVQEWDEKAALAERERAGVSEERQAIAMRERSRRVAEQELAQLLDHERRKASLESDERKLIAQLRSTLDVMARQDDGAQVPSDDDLQRVLRETQEGLETLKLEEGKLLMLIEQCNHKPGVAAGATCPTCKQRVSAEHISDVEATLAAQRLAATRKHERVVKTITESRQHIAATQARIDALRQRREIQEKLDRHEKLLRDATTELQFLRDTVKAKREHIAQMLPLAQDKTLEERGRMADQRLLEAKSALAQQRSHLLETEKRIARIEQEELGLAQAREQAVVIAAERMTHEAAVASDAASRDWLTRRFAPFASNVERYMLGAIHQHFDAAFRSWFGKLLEDDAIGARIDSEFSPVILQSGYETDPAHLSGGERTSVSLAWRLALVHSIHALVPSLGTAGLIILDEPTDGFSSEQLERVRDVLRELAMDQIILVSHEQQLEGFVDHILRVRKTNGGSVVEVTA